MNTTPDGPPDDHPYPRLVTARVATRHGRIWLILAMASTVPVMIWWLQWIADIPENGWAGGDFGVFYTAGSLVTDGKAESFYDVEAFQEQYEKRTGGVPWASAVFANPPAFALAVAPLTWMPLEAASVTWTVFSLAALVVALALLGVRHVALAAGILLLTLPAYFAIMTGQSTFFWLLIIAAIFASLNRGWLAVGGALAGLLVLKPPLLIGFGLWWLVDRRMHRALLAAVSATAAIVILSLPLVGRAWLEYPAAILRFADMHRTASGQSAQFSPWGFVDLLTPGHPGIARVVGFTAAVLGVTAFLMFYRRHRDEWQLLLAASIIATLWISPHVLAHDWVLLVVPLAVLLRVRSERAATWLLAVTVLAFVALWSYALTFVMRNDLGWAVQLAAPILGAVMWFVASALRSENPSELAAPPR